jgi:hypothetical protein
MLIDPLKLAENNPLKKNREEAHQTCKNNFLTLGYNEI